jgi:hypothetical protein
LAASLTRETDPAKIASNAYRQALSRDATTRELQLTVSFLEKQQGRTGSMEAATLELARGLFNLNEFLYVD